MRVQKAKYFILGIPILCLLAVIIVPNFISSRNFVSQNSCVNLLRQIDGAKQSWAEDYHKTTNDVPTWTDLRPYIREDVPLKCPHGGVYTIGKVGELPSCSIAWHTDYGRTNACSRPALRTQG